MPSLTERLETLRKRYAGIKPDIEEKINRHIAEMRKAENVQRVLKVGDRAPAFTLNDQVGATMSSDELLTRGALVVSFSRGTWCPYCVEELTSLSESYEDVRAAGAEIVVLTPQSPDNARAYYADHPVPFPILVDAHADVAAQFGLDYTFPDYLRNLYLGVFSNDLSVANEDRSWRLPVPGRFVINTNGVIIDAQSDPDYRFRPDPEEILAVLSNSRATAKQA